MKASWILVFIIAAASATVGYSETKKRFSLLEAFRAMAENTKKIFAPKVSPVKTISLSKDYNIHNHSVVASGRLDMFFSGVLKGKGEKFLSEARKNNICPLFLAAIAMHESANGKSSFARCRNNVFGIYLKGKYHSFESVDECIEYAAKLLAGRIYSKNPTIVGVQKIYCPVGAKNDPKGVNKYWLNGVLDKMKMLWGETIYIVQAWQGLKIAYIIAMNMLLDLIPFFNEYSQEWEVRETDENDNTLEVYGFSTEEEAEKFVDAWIRRGELSA